MSFIKLFQEGGFIMYPLLLCSIAVWTVAFEKFWTLGQFRKQANELFIQALELLKANKVEEAKGLYKAANVLIANPHLSLLEDLQAPKGVREDRVHRRLIETQMGLKRFMWVLGTVGSSAPFIGLFGTVVGIIKSFESIAQSGKSGFSVVAAGLSEALIATAAGIIVAVIAVVFYNYFLNQINSINVDFKNKVEDLNDYLNKR